MRLTTQQSGKHCYLCHISYVKYPGKGLLKLKAFQGFSKKALLLPFCWSLFWWNFASMINLELIYVQQHVKAYICIKFDGFNSQKWAQECPEQTGLLNDPLCAYLMRKNLHNRTRLRSWGNECHYHISKRSKKRTYLKALWFLMCEVGKCGKNRNFLLVFMENDKTRSLCSVLHWY